MVVKLLKPSRINHVAGEVVSTSPAQGAFLVSVGAAVEVIAPKTGEEKAEKAPRKNAKK